jgi:hypothetical protein
MTKSQIAEGRRACKIEPGACEALTVGVVVLGTDFRSQRRERVYDADRVWSGEHTFADYTEI